MRYTLLIFVAFICGSAMCFGQSIEKYDDAMAAMMAKIPSESVYLHSNAPLLFAGERLSYKFYCFDNGTKKISQLSKMGYVSLIAKDGSSVFLHKIPLKKGLGQGDFFIPVSVATGSYKLIAYSNWMKNEGIKTFFQSDIRILNPYQKLPEVHAGQYHDSLILPVGNFVQSAKAELPLPNKESDLFKISMDKSDYGSREKVRLKIEARPQLAGLGDYSLSVRKVSAFPTPTKITSKAFFRDFLKRGASRSGSNDFRGFIPELRGELISGVITNKKTGLPAARQKISLSLPGENYIHKIVLSNDKGEFHFNLDAQYDNSNAALQILSENWNDLEITLYNSMPTYNDLVFEEFVLSQEMGDDILERSIQNQLENAYLQAKPDSTIISRNGSPFYRNLSTSYLLDDYTRFNSIQETIVEVVDQAFTRKLPNGERVFAVMPEDAAPNDILPMVFVDGLFIKRHQDIMGLSAKKIKSISFSRELFLLGPQTFQGVIHLETISGNFYEDFSTPHLTKVDLFKPQAPKKYYVENYDGKASKANVPDFRHQLLWLPNLNIGESLTEIDFFTSDVKGTFEVNLEGFLSSGKPVSLRDTFTVH